MPHLIIYTTILVPNQPKIETIISYSDRINYKNQTKNDDQIV